MQRSQAQIPLNNLHFNPTVPIAIGIVFDKGYRYRYQGQDIDDEIWGEGNGVSFKYRIHDARLGRFLSIDPLTYKFAWNSPYAFSENRVIDGIEFEGLEIVFVGFNATASALISVAVDAGIIIETQSNSVYIFGGGAIGLESNVGVSGQVSLTYFPSANTYKDVEGGGWIAGVSAGELVVGSMNYAATSDFNFKGINYTLGIGIEILPISISGYYSYIGVKPFDKNDKSFIISKLSMGFSEIHDNITKLQNDIQALNTNNMILNEDKIGLEYQLNNNTQLLEKEKESIISKINVLDEKISVNNKNIESKTKDTSNLYLIGDYINNAIYKLENEK